MWITNYQGVPSAHKSAAECGSQQRIEDHLVGIMGDWLWDKNGIKNECKKL